MSNPPPASSKAARNRMENQPSRDTTAEIAIRGRLHARGYRYRVDYPVLPRRRADIVFRKQMVAVFVDGCFWHQCPEHATKPVANREWWEQKLAANVERDRDTDRRLRENGWQVIRIWEHEDPEESTDRIESFLRKGIKVTKLSPEIASRVAFSYESFMYATEWLAWKQEPDEGELGMWNAHVDSFVVHARRLRDFLLEEGNHDDDLHLSDLVDDVPDIALPRTNELRDQMNKRVLHLTKQAEPELPHWSVASIAKELGQAMNSVIEAMRANGSDHYARFNRAREGRPGFGKLIS